jgi:cytochrome c-type biogenesis protein CcmF
MAFTLLAALAAFMWRIDTLKSREKLDSMLSRESAFLTQNVLFIAVAFITLWGTIYPVFSEAASDVVITVGQPFFDRVNGPILLVLVFLMGVGPLLPWRRANMQNVLSALRVPLIGATIVTIGLIVVGVRQPIPLVAIAVCVIAVFGIGHEWLRGSRSRHRKGESYPVAFGKLLGANRPRYGGYIVHLGISMLAIGAIGSSFYDTQRDFNMALGGSASIGGYDFTYLDVGSRTFSDRVETTARFDVSRGGKRIEIMDARRTFYVNSGVSATHPAIRSTLIEDFYIVPSEFTETGAAVFRVYVNPMVWWMWAAGPLFILGTLLALSPRRRPAPVTLPLPKGVQLARA